MTRIKVNIPEGRVGEWSVKKFIGDHTTIYNQAHGQPVHRIHSDNDNEPYGEYTFLIHDVYGPIMQDTASEYLEHEPLWVGATGDVLIAGLGIGFVNQKLIDNPNVTSVTIVEKNQDVIDLVWQHCPKNQSFTLVHADIETWVPPQGSHWNYAWFDSWCGGNEMDLVSYQQFIINRYQPYCDQIGVWNEILS